MPALIACAALGAAAYLSTPQGVRKADRFIVRRMKATCIDNTVNAMIVQTAGHKRKIRAEFGLDDGAELIAGYPRALVVTYLCMVAVCTALPRGIGSLSRAALSLAFVADMNAHWRLPVVKHALVPADPAER